MLGSFLLRFPAGQSWSVFKGALIALKLCWVFPQIECLARCILPVSSWEVNSAQVTNNHSPCSFCCCCLELGELAEVRALLGLCCSSVFWLDTDHHPLTVPGACVRRLKCCCFIISMLLKVYLGFALFYFSSVIFSTYSQRVRCLKTSISAQNPDQQLWQTVALWKT